MLENTFKTILLLGVLSGLLLLIGSVIGGASGLTIALILACILNGITYFFSETIVLKVYQAQSLDRSHYGWIYQSVDLLAQSMRIPAPKLWIIKTPMANAFATGRNPRHASIVITTGILDILDADELRGVLAHELSHIKNYDVLVSTIVVTIATAISYLAQMLQHVAFWASVSGSKDSRNQRTNPLNFLLLAIITPIIASLLQLAVSRTREYLADETGAHYSREPLALASALLKIQNSAKAQQFGTQGPVKQTMASLYIINPFRAKDLGALFSTHPPTEKRVERLKKMLHLRF